MLFLVLALAAVALAIPAPHTRRPMPVQPLRLVSARRLALRDFARALVSPFRGLAMATTIDVGGQRRDAVLARARAIRSEVEALHRMGGRG